MTDKREPETKKLMRLVRILGLIDKGKEVSPDSLAAEFGVDRRSIFRDITDLCSADIPVEYDHSARTYRFRGDFSLKKLHLSKEETQLILMTQQFAQKMGAPFQKAARNLFEKIQQGASIKHTSARHVLKLDVTAAEQDRIEKNFLLLEEAIQHRRRVWIRYQSIETGDITERTIAPYYFAWGIGETFLRAYCFRGKGPRFFAMDGILDAKITNDGYEIPSDMNPEDEIKDGFGVFIGPIQNVEIRFRPEASGQVKRKIWHPKQKIEEKRDGTIILKMQVSSYAPLINWILGWGGDAEVLKPKMIRDEVAMITKNMARLYESKGK